MANKHIMLDLETFGTSSNAVIVSIGAVKFNKEFLLDEFYTVVDPQSCIDHGMEMDGGAVLWWLKQSEEARIALTKEKGKPLPDALTSFTRFTGKNPIIWGNGSDFDNIILANAYKSARMVMPWCHRNNRCYRTVKNMNRHIKMQRLGTHHNALDDAKDQARHLIQIMKDIK